MDNKAKRPSLTMAPLHLPGDVLLSQDPSVQVSSALEVLTSVFGMGTGGTPPVLSPDLLLSRFCVWGCSLKTAQILTRHYSSIFSLLKFEPRVSQPSMACVRSSPRPISTRQLHASRHFHSGPSYLIILQGSYQLSLWEISSWGRLRA